MSDEEARTYAGIMSLLEAIYARAEADLGYVDDFDGDLIAVEAAHHAEALEWLEADVELDEGDPGKWGSFRHLCFILGRNPSSERKRLRKVARLAEETRSSNPRTAGAQHEER